MKGQNKMTKKLNEPKELKSLSLNDVVTKPQIKDNINKPLVNIHGFISSYFTHTTKFGENTGFKGDFVAISCLDNSVYISSAAFLPNGLTEQILKQLSQGLLEVEFKATIKAISSDKSPYGYAIIADEPETEQRQNRRAALMQRALADAPLLLEKAA